MVLCGYNCVRQTVPKDIAACSLGGEKVCGSLFFHLGSKE